jgi:hypothetical protein
MTDMRDPGFAADDARRERIADELEGAGWPAVAEDVREGLDLDTVVERLRDIGEGDSEAVEILTWVPE